MELYIARCCLLALQAQTSSLLKVPTCLLVHRRGGLFEATAGAFSSLFSRPSPAPSASQQVCVPPGGFHNRPLEGP